MSAQNAPHAEFARPPLSEVVLSVQTEPIDGLTTPYLGLFWNDIRNQYPVVEVHPALEPVTERFGGPDIIPQRGFRILEKVETPRCWFISPDGTALLQLQQDRLIYNWRERRASPYPRYENLRPEFEKQAQRLVKFLAKEQLGSFVPNQCEISYVNHVRTDDRSSRSALYRDFSFSPPFADLGFTEPEDVAFSARFLLGPANEPVGRLHASLTTGFRPADNTVILIFTLTVRGQPATPDLAGTLAFFDFGREQIHRAFLSLTSEKIQRQAWGRK